MELELALGHGLFASRSAGFVLQCVVLCCVECMFECDMCVCLYLGWYDGGVQDYGDTTTDACVHVPFSPNNA